MHLVSYDITTDALRNKTIKVLLRYGLQRVQFSVFIGVLKPVSYNRLQKALKALQQQKQWLPNDSIMVLPLHQYTRDHLWFLGAEPDTWGQITDTSHTLIF
jgi:CRISPR-associated endonuclease Cas2